MDYTRENLINKLREQVRRNKMGNYDMDEKYIMGRGYPDDDIYDKLINDLEQVINIHKLVLRQVRLLG